MTDLPAAWIDLEIGIGAVLKVGGAGGAPEGVLLPHQREALARIEQQTAGAQRPRHHRPRHRLRVGVGGARGGKLLSLGRLALGPQGAPQRHPCLRQARMFRHDRRDQRLRGGWIAPSQHLHGEQDFAAGARPDSGERVYGQPFARPAHQRV